MKPAEKKDPVIIALDFDSAREADSWSALGDSAGFYKVGMELFAAAGMDYVRSLADRGKRVFLDLKYYDIGETVKTRRGRGREIRRNLPHRSRRWPGDARGG